MDFNKRVIDISHELIKECICEGSIVVDATIGNGNDTLYLANLVGETGKVYGFDIQKQAIDTTYNKLLENHMNKRVTIIHDSHCQIDKYISEKIDCAIYNLGYLPSGDKSIITKGETTVKSLHSVINKLNIKGKIVIVSYYGHEGGKDEKNILEEYLKKIDYKEVTVCRMDYINKPNCPPVFYCIEKRY